jgi:hypothetical protein
MFDFSKSDTVLLQGSSAPAGLLDGNEEDMKVMMAHPFRRPEASEQYIFCQPLHPPHQDQV